MSKIQPVKPLYTLNTLAVKILLLQRNLSLRTLAARLRCPYVSIYKSVHNQRPGMATRLAPQIALVLGVPLRDILIDAPPPVDVRADAGPQTATK